MHAVKSVGIKKSIVVLPVFGSTYSRKVSENSFQKKLLMTRFTMSNSAVLTLLTD